MEKITIIPDNVCADRIFVQVENDAIVSVEFDGGCHGNGQALGRLLQGMRVDEAIQRLSGIDCEGKGTSCADQFAKGMREQACAECVNAARKN